MLRASSPESEVHRLRRFAVPVLAVALLAGLLSARANSAPRVEGARAVASKGRPCPGTARACLRVGKPCAKRYEKTYRRHRLTCKSGRLHKSAPPPDDSGDDIFPPPPLAPPVPGHYTGTSSQGHPFAVDVLPPTTMANFQFDLDETCTPSLSFTWGTTFAQKLPIGAGGVVTWTGGGGTGTIRGTLARFGGSFYAKFDGTTVKGDFSLDVQLTEAGTDYSCTSGPVSWTATRSG